MSKDLTAQDIKRIRRKYGLTQQGFARLLGLGEASVVRYENGQTPSKANANLIRAADNPASCGLLRTRRRFCCRTSSAARPSRSSTLWVNLRRGWGYHGYQRDV